MLCVVIKGPTYADISRQIQNIPPGVELIELRIDCFQNWDEEALKRLMSRYSIPMIFTLRKPGQGGFFAGDEQARLDTIRRLAKLNPHYLDLESDVEPSFAKEIRAQHPDIKLIVSYHNFNETPEDLNSIYEAMRAIPANMYKIAAKANTQIDAMRLLELAKKGNQCINTMSMGNEEEPSRILGPILGCPITYASLDRDSKTAKGQFSAKTLLDVYHFSNLNKETKIFGLIGDPVSLSIGHYTHNDLFVKLGIDAVYVKIPVQAGQLDGFLKYAHQLGFSGLSVTMPLKEDVLASIDHLDADANKIGAVNTLSFANGAISGYNTDGIGALNAIEEIMSVKDKRIILLGAGGAAKAIAFEACRRGGKVVLLNRTLQRALDLSRRFADYPHECKALGQMQACYEEGYDVLINCTSHHMPISSDFILPHAAVMDIHTRPKETEFLQEAKRRGCPVIYGYKMFIEQALGQFAIWFKGQIDIPYAKRKLEEKIAKLNLALE